jgi:hypothetical protein
MKLKEIYILALAEGISAKEAGWKYNVNSTSLSKKGCYHKLPPLKSDFFKKDCRELEKFDIGKLMKYRQSLENELNKVQLAINKSLNEQPKMQHNESSVLNARHSS